MNQYGFSVPQSGGFKMPKASTFGSDWGAPTNQTNPLFPEGSLTAGLVDLPRVGEAPRDVSRGFFDSSALGANGEKLSMQGWGMPALQVATGAFNAWMGMKNYGLQKRQLAHSKQEFGLNYDAQRTTTNAQLEDRQRARVSSAPAGAYQSVGDYMSQNGIKPR